MKHGDKEKRARYASAVARQANPAKRQGYGRQQVITGGAIRQHGRQAEGFQAAGRARKRQGSAAGEAVRQAAARQA